MSDSVSLRPESSNSSTATVRRISFAPNESLPANVELQADQRNDLGKSFGPQHSRIIPALKVGLS
ncbi:hypothetical protein N7527_007270 [Penicillium freii]|nr:hypothetical protein N7527_007270 [Penicillium freii]